MTDTIAAIRQILSRLGGRNSQEIFISYRRRGEGAGYAGRLADRLVQEFGPDRCFRDIDDIESGTDFVETISNAVGRCEVFIVVMGPDWLTTTDASGQRRLDNPHDFVRLEVEAALSRNVRVVPVLVGGAVMPAAEQLPPSIAALSRRQAHELSDLRWEYDIGELIGQLEKLGIPRQKRRKSGKPRRTLVFAVTFGVVAVIATASATALARLYDDNRIAEDTTLATPPSDAISRDVKGGVAQESPPERVVQQAPPRATAPVEDPARANARLRAAILEAIHRANDAERHALRHLDATVLERAFAGAALQREIAAVQELQQIGHYAVNELHGQEILSIQANGSMAVVEAVETWSSTYYNALTGECTARHAPIRVPQTVQLERTLQGWIVVRIETRAAAPELVPCALRP